MENKTESAVHGREVFCQEKPWQELAGGDKIERLAQRLIWALREIEDLQRSARQFSVHSHAEGGGILVPLHSGAGPVTSRTHGLAPEKK